MRTTLAAAEGTNSFIVLVAIAVGPWIWWNGLKTWRGEELSWILRYEREHGPYRSFTGGRRQYQTRMGAGHMGILVGPGVLLVGVGEGLRAALGESRGWWLYELIAGSGGVLVAVGGLYLLVYYVLGVPDWLRPPCQRGWEIVDGELQLVRPEAFHEHPKHRATASGSDEAPRGYDPWR